MEFQQGTQLDRVHSSVGLFLLAGLGRIVTLRGFVPEAPRVTQGNPGGPAVESLQAPEPAGDTAVIQALEASY